MKKLMSVMACFAACSMGISAALAGGPACHGATAQKAGDKGATCAGKSACCQTGEFPRMVRMVGDQAVECPMTAAKMAKDNNAKIVFAVAGNKFDTEQAAWGALADESEMFVKKYTSIACVMDGKTYFVCDESGKCCSMKNASACSKGDAAKGEKVASTAGASCHGKTEAKAVKVDEKDAKSAGCSKSCVSKTGDGSDCCGSKANAIAVIDSKTCAEMCKKSKDTKYMVAGKTYPTWDDAVKARTELVTAVHNIKMKYLVDGKEVDCSSKVCPKAKAEGKVKYVVGEKQMECELMARVELAKAQYDAAQHVGTKSVATKM